MKNLYFIVGLLHISLLISCNNRNQSDKTFDANSNVIDVNELIVPIIIEDPLLSSFSVPYVINDYLIMTDTKSYDSLIHIFDNKNFQHIKSFGEQGNGPTEIANLVGLIINENNNSFYVIDYGKEGLMAYPIDSILSNPEYIPNNRSIFNKQQVPLKTYLISDSLSYALCAKVSETSEYKPVTSKLNLYTGDISYLKHEGHPDIKRKRVSMAASRENNLFVEAYWHHELLSFCSLDGSLKYYVYGKNWDSKTQNSELYFEDIVFCKNKLFVSYWGGERFVKKFGEITTNDPDKLLVFDIMGNHLHTLNVSKPIINMCYDEINNRIIFAFDDEIQFGYLDISKWL